MSWLDIGILVVVGGFTLAGFWFGLVHMVGSLVGIFLGVFVAGKYFDPLATWAQSLLGGSLNIWRVVAFTLLYVLVNRLLGVLIGVLDKLFSFISIIPFMKTFGRLLGAIFGFIEGVFVISLAVYLAAKFPFGDVFVQALQQSRFSVPLNAIGMILEPLLPEAVKLLQSIL